MNKYQKSVDYLKSNYVLDNPDDAFCKAIMTTMNVHFSNLQELVDKEEKYRWHDLTKDPKDLPKCKQKVLVYRQVRENEYEYAIDYNCNDHDGIDCHYEVWESDLIGYTVLKWKYIEEAN